MIPAQMLMNGEQARFFCLLEKFPSLVNCWNPELRECRPDRVAAIEKFGSSGEIIAIRCLVAIWSGSSTNQSLAVSFAAIATLSPSERRALAEWLADPYWP